MGAEDGHEGGGMEPPSPTVIFLIVVCVCVALIILCSTVAKRLRRSRSTRSIVERLTHRLGRTANESNYPAARPSKYMRRFAGISVVDANAMVDEVHYVRLREFPETLVEVSEVGTNVDSADFSASEVATTTASVYSRSATRLPAHHPHRHRQGREGSLSSEPSTGKDDVNNSWSRFSSMVAEPDEMSDSRAAEDIEGDGVEMQRMKVNSGSGYFHLVPPSANVEPARGVCDARGEDVEKDFSLQPMSLQCSSRGAWKSTHTIDAFPTSPVHHTGPGTFGRCVITNISVEDLAAHCAALQEDDKREDGEENLMDTPAAAAVAAAADCGASPSPPAVSASADVTTHSYPLPPPRDGATTPLTPYTYIMREKSRRANGGGARSVVIVEPERSSGGSGSGNEDMDASASSSNTEKMDGADGTHRAGHEDDAAVAARRARRTVHREHHRHHTSKGGYIVCEDFVPDLASRRMRRQQTAAKKPRFIFQLRDEEALYGRAQYVPREPQDRAEDDKEVEGKEK